MKAELDKLYVMKTSGSIPAQYQHGMEPLRFLGCLIERIPDGQIIMHQRSYIEHCFKENDMELMKGGVTFLLAELWFCRNLGRSHVFQAILNRIQSTVVYANMAMVHRLCPALALTPINTNHAAGTGLLKTEAGSLELMQSTQWIYERGMHELQEAAIENFHDIPVQVDTWTWSDWSSFPVATCKATYLTFPLPKSDKGSDRLLREKPTLTSYTKCVVMPYHDSGLWRRLKPISIPETVSYKARRAQDGEMEVGEGEGQPEYKDSTERVQDLAEDETGEGESMSQTIIASQAVSFSAFKSKFEPYEKGGLVMKREVYEELQFYECPLCKTIIPEGQEIVIFPITPTVVRPCEGAT